MSSWTKVNIIIESLLYQLFIIEKRNFARMQKNFNLADEIRKKLLDLGVEVKDSQDGVKWNWIK